VSYVSTDNEAMLFQGFHTFPLSLPCTPMKRKFFFHLFSEVRTLCVCSSSTQIYCRP